MSLISLFLISLSPKRKTLHLMKKIKFGLLPRIIVAIILGIGCGNIFNEPLVRIFVTFNGIFSQFLGFMIPLIIVGLVTPAISDIGKGAGKLLAITTLIAYCDTIFAGFLSYGTGVALFPSMISTGQHVSNIAQAAGPATFFTVTIPPLMDVMTALILSFTLGLGIAYLNSKVMKNMFDEFKEIISGTIRVVIIPLLPLYIFGIFINMTFTGQVYSVLSVFIKIIAVIFALHILLLIFQYCVAGAFVKKNPFRLLGRMMPAYFTALGTSSSAATIPVTLKSTIKNGVTDGIAGFVIPLCATIHMTGSSMKITACALAIMMMQGMPHSFTLMAGFICMLGIVMVAAPGVPGGCIMAALGILGSILGFNANDQALMIALYIAMDNFGTACNVTGDGAIALVIDKFFKKKMQVVQ
jgi:Na+/H+-dicarboxylate symporter